MFWAAMARGEFITDARLRPGTHRKQGTRWLAAAVANRVQSSTVPLPRIAAGVFVIGGLVVLTLLLVADRYGYLGDEFYFVVTGRHLQLAAPDNPMLVPYLAAGGTRWSGAHLWAFRILPALAAGGYVLLGGLSLASSEGDGGGHAEHSQIARQSPAAPGQ